MEAAFELPIQSPTGERIVIDRTTTAPPPPSALARPQPRAAAQPRASLPPKRIPPAAASGGSFREPKLRRTALPREPDGPGARGPAGRPKARTSPHAAPKPLLPATERKSQEENKLDRLSKKDALDGDKWDVAPDGSSAGREGRQFTVANVGNNGRIYLKPTVRPAHLRFPQPNFVFPMTPPGTAGLDLLTPQDRDRRGDQQQRPQQKQPQQRPYGRQPLQLRLDGAAARDDWTVDQDSSPTAPPPSWPRFPASGMPRSGSSVRPATAGAAGGRSGGGHRRAVSDSTVQDTSIARESEPGGFKIVITQPAEEQQRARTLEDLVQGRSRISAPHLEVSIPTWKLGTPRFTMRGTPVLRGSSYAPTEEPQSSRPSYFAPAFDHSHSLLEEEDGPALPQQGTLGREPNPSPGYSALSSSLPSPRFRPDDPARGLRATYHSNYVAIEPAMFDALTFKPACDDRAIVRFSPSALSITAATPPRLVAEITSPKFMDYDLVSDFFLTYRSFLEPHDLLRMLVARLRWAVARDDEAGMVVRVRTFVALRHWVLNYFMDDFVIDYSLRVLFCNLLNSFVDELSNDPRGRKVQLKILTELKKCWRRSCAQYWDGPDFDDTLGPDVPISPGGIAGHRNPNLDPSFWEQAVVGEGDLAEDDDNDQPTFLTHFHSPESMVDPEPGSSFHATGERAGHIDSIVLGNRPSTPENQGRLNEIGERRQASPVSITSLDFVSCSFPTKNMRLLQASMGPPLGAHPVEPSLTYSSSGPVAMTPRALVGKRVRPSDSQKPSAHTYQHKRNNSLTDSLRDHASTAENLSQRNTELLMSLAYAGSLVRGAVFPPGQPYVEVLPPGTSGSASRQTTIFQSFPLQDLDLQKEKASAMSSQGMRKLLGSVRRALSTRGQADSPTHGNFINISPLGPRGATTNRLPGTSIVPQARPRLNGTRSPVRIDLLGAKIAEDFKAAVREDASVDAAALQDEEEIPPAAREAPKFDHLAAASKYSDSLFLGWAPDGRDDLVRPMSDAGITTGSKSIVIVDDTFPLDFPAMAGALPAGNGSAEMLGETFLSVAADPTPPTTPPGHLPGTPRRSSYILGQHAAQPSLSNDPLPLFIPRPDELSNHSVAAPAAPLPVGEESTAPPSNASDHELDSIILPRQSTDEGQDTTTLDSRVPADSFGMPSSPPLFKPRSSWARGHFRHQSSRSQKSSRSFGRRRAVSSVLSGVAPHARLQSFDASTCTDASIGDSPEVQVPEPLRVLRRRPGGDLRAIANVGDMDRGRPRRPHSIGSLTTYSESIRSSYVRGRAPESSGFVDVISVDFSHSKEDTFSVGMMTDKKPKARVSLFSAHSSKPVMRPSFEAEAQKLAQIPDDVDDDGGVESALLKLEGRFERKSKKLSFSEPSFNKPSADAAAKGSISIPPDGFLATQDPTGQRLTTEEKLDHRHQHIIIRDAAPSSHSRPATLGQIRDDAVSTEVDIEDSHGGTDADEPRGSSMAASSQAPAFSLLPHGRPGAAPRMGEDVQSFLSEGSGESYSSIPLLDRGLTDDGRSKGAPTDEWGHQSVWDEADGSDQQTPTAPVAAAAAAPGHARSHMGSYEMVEKTGSIERILPGDTMPQSSRRGTELSFLDDESDRASDLSSELSAEASQGEEDDDIFGYAPRNLAKPSKAAALRLPAHPLGDPQLEPAQKPPILLRDQHPGRLLEEPLDNHPPSPPMTLVQALQMSPNTANIPELHDHQVWDSKPLPATPSPEQPEPSTLRAARQLKEAAVLDSMGLRPFAEQKPGAAAAFEAASNFSVHLPFILAFDSEILAQQFTLIEKDALHEIDWKELIDMRWKNAENSDARSWVDFLRNSEARGVEVVIARFNIMVKWVVSEVVLTQDLEERARCIIKFIHIAAHSRRHRNYATMSQIALALTSNEVSRLARTWALIPPSDARTLRDLEALVSPTRNFYNLRAEMEAVDSDNADAGCIPFVGIYTHDLLFNAQRPSEIASSPTTAPLVNFERCRFAASIVKTLLRLVEASALYSFQPIEGITERCLWMSALGDDAIRKWSQALE